MTLSFFLFAAQNLFNVYSRREIRHKIRLDGMEKYKVVVVGGTSDLHERPAARRLWGQGVLNCNPYKI